MKKTKPIFNIRELIINIPKKKRTATGWETIQTEYLPVAARVAWFRKFYPIESGWKIRTKIEGIAEGKVRVRGQIVDPEGKIVAEAMRTGDKTNFSDYIEKAETGAVGRALALAGFDLVSAPDLDEEDALATAPIEKKGK